MWLSLKDLVLRLFGGLNSKLKPEAELRRLIHYATEAARTDPATRSDASGAGEGGLSFSQPKEPVLPPLPITASVSNVLPIRDAKNTIRHSGYQPADVKAFVDQHLNLDAYQSLEGTNPLYIPAPSTSGRNTIPQEMAERLQQRYGGSIADRRFIEAKARTQAKDRPGYIAKQTDPSRFTVDPQLSQLARGRTVVIVDDILTSGETIDGLQAAMHRVGIDPARVVTIAALDSGKAVGRASLSALARKISRLTGGTSPRRSSATSWLPIRTVVLN